MNPVVNSSSQAVISEQQPPLIQQNKNITKQTQQVAKVEGDKTKNGLSQIDYVAISALILSAGTGGLAVLSSGHHLNGAVVGLFSAAVTSTAAAVAHLVARNKKSALFWGCFGAVSLVASMACRHLYNSVLLENLKNEIDREFSAIRKDFPQDDLPSDEVDFCRNHMGDINGQLTTGKDVYSAIPINMVNKNYLFSLNHEYDQMRVGEVFCREQFQDIEKIQICCKKLFSRKESLLKGMIRTVGDFFYNGTTPTLLNVHYWSQTYTLSTDDTHNFMCSRVEVIL